MIGILGVGMHGVGMHGVGGQTDLPIPFEYAVIGGAWALTVSFGVLVFAWKSPRFSASATSTPSEIGLDVVLAPRRWWLSLAGMVVAALVLWPLWFESGQRHEGAVAFVYTWLWVGLVPLALAFGHVWRDVSPWRTLAGLISREGLTAYPRAWGYWPAAFGLFTFVWWELVSPRPESVAWWVAGYAVLMLAGGVACGPRWFDRADPLDVYSAIVAKLGRGLRSLTTIPIDAGLVAVIAVLLGSTAFDSFSASQMWQTQQPSVLVNTVMMLAFVVIVAAAFTLAVRPADPRDLAHTLVPIVVGYVVAHYATFLVEKGQRAIIDLLALDATPSLWLSMHPSVVGAIKVIAVVTGHVVAVVAAHDRSLAVLPASKRLTGQLPLMLVMVALTFSGLYLLLSL